MDIPCNTDHHPTKGAYSAMLHSAEDVPSGPWTLLGSGSTMRLEALLEAAGETSRGSWALVCDPAGVRWRAWIEAGKLITSSLEGETWQTIRRNMPLEQAFRAASQLTLPASAHSRPAPCRPLRGRGRPRAARAHHGNPA